MTKENIFHSFMLILCSVIWGTSFVWQSESVGLVGPVTFTALRFLIGAAVLAPVVFILRRVGHRTGSLPWRAGLACGTVLAAAACLQQIGIQTVSPGKAGFMTTMYIVLVPLISVFVGKKPRLNVIIAAVLAAVGLYLLCVGEEGFVFTPGDAWLVASAVMFAVQILFIDRFVSDCDGLELSFVQFVVCGAWSFLVALALERGSFMEIGDGIVPVLKSGVLSCGCAYTLQTLGQKGLDPTAASLLMSGESVFAAIAGWLLMNSVLSTAELIGCAVMFCAVILSQITFKKRVKE